MSIFIPVIVLISEIASAPPASAEDAVEFMRAGASAVAVGAMNFHDPYLTEKVIDGMEKYLVRHSIGAARELTGAVR